MAVTSNRVIGIRLEGDVNAPNLAYEAAENASSPGSIQTTDLALGNNSITVPSGSTAVTIIPPAANTETITLKGVNGDTGIDLHLTDPSSIAIKSSVTTFVLSATDVVTGLRLIWS